MATRAKFGYLNYEEMISLLGSDDPKKKLDAYDIVFCKDTKEQYWISPELEPLSVRSRILCFDSTADAYEELNKDTATYNGQLVAIKTDTKYESYMVNTNTAGKFYATPVSAYSELDYNTLINRPIENVVGTLDKPIIVDQLSSGVYNILGQYQISSLLKTVFVSTSSNMFFVNQSDDVITIKKLNADAITIYTIADEEISTKSVVTDDMLGDFATTEYLDARIKALDILTMDDVKDYVDTLLATTIEEMVEQKVEEVFDETLDERIDSRLDTKLSDAEIAEDSIENLFA